MPWKGEGGFVAPGGVGPAANALLELVENRLPQTFYVEAPAQWWTVAGPALVARAGQTLRSTLGLYEHRCDLDAATLTRTLIEQLFTFAYLAHDPDARLLSYESADHEQALSVTKGMHRLGYAEFPAPHWPSEQLGARPAPLRLKIHQLADHADVEWPHAPRLFLDPGADGRPFRTLYESIYKPACRAVHGKAYVTAAFIDDAGQPTVIVRAQERARSVIAYEWAILSFAILLAIAGDCLGWPSRSDLLGAMADHMPVP